MKRIADFVLSAQCCPSNKRDLNIEHVQSGSYRDDFKDYVVYNLGSDCPVK